MVTTLDTFPLRVYTAFSGRLRFNRNLKESFVVPRAATLKQSELKLNVDASNAPISRWLSEVANVRVHATTRQRPAAKLADERAAVLPLPTPTSTPMPAVSKLRRVLSREPTALNALSRDLVRLVQLSTL